MLSSACVIVLLSSKGLECETLVISINDEEPLRFSACAATRPGLLADLALHCDFQQPSAGEGVCCRAGLALFAWRPHPLNAKPRRACENQIHRL